LLALSGFVFATHARGDGMLQDSDTVILLTGIRETQNPWAWFVGDWPLENHFYRPISTLTLEFDNAVYGEWDPGYGRTNAILAALSILGLFWFLREATDRPWIAGLGMVLFALWHRLQEVAAWASGPLIWLALLVWLVLLRDGRQKFATVLLASGALLFASQLLLPFYSLEYRMLQWIPGRTASTMTVFCLLSLAGYARFERLRGVRLPQPPLPPTEPPPTKGTPPRPSNSPWDFGWLVVSVLAAALALGSYEQAVMLPALLLGVAFLFHLHGVRPHYWVHIGFWALLGGYLALRYQLVPSEVSTYQDQQFRSGPGLYQSLVEYLFPGWFGLREAYFRVTTSPLVLLTVGFWTSLAFFLSNILAYVVLWKSRLRWYAFGFLGFAFFAFLPMAWLKHFAHYHYWPFAFYAVFTVLLVAEALRWLITAVGRPSLQAPSRPSPAPGSLPRP
jgi:hypothetical protein